MRKLLFHFAIAVKVVLSVSQLAYGGERPASAPPIDERLTGIESRVNGHDTEIAELSRKIDALKLAIRCPCPRGGECICGEECLCPNCPKHSKAKASTAKPDYSNTVFEGNGRHALVFTATWCGPCKEAEKIRDACGLVEGVDYNLIDVDRHPEHKAKYNINSLPALVLLDGETVAHHHVGPTFQGEKIKAWMSGKPLPAGAGAKLGNGKPSAPAATSRPVVRMTVTRGNGPGHTHRCSYCGTSWSHENWNVGSPSAHTCPNCRRITYGNRTEGWNAPYQTRSLPVSYQFQPRVQFATGYSYGTCPNCPR